jgi:hypothetical protein
LLGRAMGNGRNSHDWLLIVVIFGVGWVCQKASTEVKQCRRQSRQAGTASTLVYEMGKHERHAVSLTYSANFPACGSNFVRAVNQLVHHRSH